MSLLLLLRSAPASPGPGPDPGPSTETAVPAVLVRVVAAGEPYDLRVHLVDDVTAAEMVVAEAGPGQAADLAIRIVPADQPADRTVAFPEGYP